MESPAYFPWFSAAVWHHLFEVLALTVAGQLAWRFGGRTVASLGDPRRRLVVLGGAILGAVLGARLLHALTFAPTLWAERAPLAAWFGGKTLVGGLLGAIAGVELAKRALGIRDATGDAFVPPLAVGIALGRLGCFAAGLADGTYGTPTSLPWGVDFGDGVARHPTQLYEALAALALGVLLVRWRTPALVAGDRFRLFVIGDLALRFAVDFLKPPFGAAAPTWGPPLVPSLYGGVLTAIQIACLFGCALYAPAALRLAERLRGARPEDDGANAALPRA
jgi:prolipoprotein diacylglyceryltransferase